MTRKAAIEAVRELLKDEANILAGLRMNPEWQKEYPRVREACRLEMIRLREMSTALEPKRKKPND